MSGFPGGSLSRLVAGGLLLLGLVAGTAPLLQAAPASAPARPWNRVRSFLYQLQKAEPAAVAATGFDLVVTDYSRDGTDAGRYARADIERMQCSPRGRKLVLAYLSIGEAEDYRWYWRPEWKSKPPAWLEKLNPDWPGNYKVKYWDPEWQEIIHGSLRKIVEAGFDGVYLDIIDGYEYFEEKGVKDAAGRMEAFVLRIASWARSEGGGPDFGVFPQNGEGLLERPAYMSAITGQGRETVWFGWEGVAGRPTPREDSQPVQALLDRAVKRGRLVLTIDYTQKRSQVDEAYRRAAARGYVEYCTTKALDRLIVNEGHEPVPSLGPHPARP